MKQIFRLSIVSALWQSVKKAQKNIGEIKSGRRKISVKIDLLTKISLFPKKDFESVEINIVSV